MKITMQQRCAGRVQAIRANKSNSNTKAFAPAASQFAGLRRSNVLDIDIHASVSLTQVRNGPLDDTLCQCSSGSRNL